jgi:hypothetical protein
VDHFCRVHVSESAGEKQEERASADEMQEERASKRPPKAAQDLNANVLQK